jgi:hypothetical protein
LPYLLQCNHPLGIRKHNFKGCRFLSQIPDVLLLFCSSSSRTSHFQGICLLPSWNCTPLDLLTKCWGH